MGVTHQMKEQKRNILPGIKSRWQMYSQILTVAIQARNSRGMRRYSKVTRQFYKLSRP